MMFLRSHVLLMFVYAVAAGVFFSFLWKRGRRERLRFFLIVFSSLFFGGIAVAWLMYPFPLR
ncbi:MAG TPA: hypothetical protein VMT00_14300 [Thermoanaerobaculia bacterium]|nr:hypothetical protein [Thermoanaerobaculia bacterium]